MKLEIAALGTIILVGFYPLRAQAQPQRVSVLNGNCTAQSHIAEGPRGVGLTGRHARYFCDSAVISMNPANGDMMFQFADRRSVHQQPIGFAGGLDEPNMLTVERVYLEPGVPVTPNDGYCRLFFKGKAKRGNLSQITAIVCGAQIDEEDRRTVPVISFKVK